MTKKKQQTPIQMKQAIRSYNASQPNVEKKICNLLMKEIDSNLKGAESKMWHGGPVWFLDGNPVAGYWKRKQGIQLMFWSGMSFHESALLPIGNVKKFKAAGVIYTDPKELNLKDIRRWIRKSKTIQWDYKNIVKRKGKLVRITKTKLQ